MYVYTLNTYLVHSFFTPRQILESQSYFAKYYKAVKYLLIKEGWVAVRE